MRSATIVILCFLSSTCAGADLDVWIGTGTPRGSQAAGIYHLKLDDSNGKLSPATLMAERPDAGFLAMHPSLPVIYSTAGGVSGWRIGGDQSQPRLELINETPTGDGQACHVAVDRSGQVLLSAQYGGGSISSFPLSADGVIGALVENIKHNTPSGVVNPQQQSCHPHWIGTSPDNRFVLVPDLGADKIYIYRLDAATGRLTKHRSAATPGGGGPRHFKFHPTLPVGYVVNEFGMSLSILGYASDAGELKQTQTIPTLSKEQIAGERFNSGSEVRVHPSGKFVYSANRGHDSITAFSVDQATGELSLIEQEPIRGCWPRNFNLDPSGRWLLAAGGESNTLAVFAIDQQTGALQYARQIQSVPAPICVLIEAPR